MMNAAKELLTFIENSPSMFHSIETIKGMLDEAGFTYLPERNLLGREAGAERITRSATIPVSLRSASERNWAITISRCAPPTVIHRLTRSRMYRS